MAQTRHYHVYPSATVLAERVAAAVLRIATATIARGNDFHLVATGGSTPRLLYERLAEADADWSHWHIWHGDERCLPSDHPERNSLLVQRTWLDKVALPAAQHHVIPAELGPEEAAARYARALANQPAFSLVLLGLGEDGHAASLFPGHDWPFASGDTYPVHTSPKPPAERVSLTPSRLARADHVFFLVAGAAKHHALHAWQSGSAVPAAAICPLAGVEIFCDLAAWSGA